MYVCMHACMYVGQNIPQLKSRGPWTVIPTKNREIMEVIAATHSPSFRVQSVCRPTKLAIRYLKLT